MAGNKFNEALFTDLVEFKAWFEFKYDEMTSMSNMIENGINSEIVYVHFLDKAQQKLDDIFKKHKA